MSDLLDINDDDLEAAARALNEAAEALQGTRSPAPIGEVRGLTGLESRVSVFLRGTVTGRRALGDSAQSSALAVAAWMSDGSRLDDRLSVKPVPAGPSARLG